MIVDDEWANYLNGEECEFVENINISHPTTEPPKCSAIYISTKTKIAYLTTTIDLADVFWKIPVIEYFQPVEGVVKKEMKINSIEKSEFDEMQEKLTNAGHYEEHIITHIDNPDGKWDPNDL